MHEGHDIAAEQADTLDRQAADQLMLELAAKGLQANIWRMENNGQGFMALVLTHKEAFDLSHMDRTAEDGRRKFQQRDPLVPRGLLNQHLEQHPRTRRGETRYQALSEAQHAYYQPADK
jgi:hypothetical protein